MNEECSICLDIIQNPVETPCNHFFCFNCLKDWQDVESNTPRCPLCRQMIEKIQPIIEIVSLPIVNESIIIENQRIVERSNFEKSARVFCIAVTYISIVLTVPYVLSQII